MSQDDVRTMQNAYEAFNRGDIPAVTEVMTSDVEWNEPGGGRAPQGTFTGPQSVAEDVFSTVPDNFEDFRAEVNEWIDARDRLVVTGHFRGTAKSGEAIDVPFVHVWMMRGGKSATFHNLCRPADLEQGLGRLTPGRRASPGTSRRAKLKVCPRTLSMPVTCR